MASFTADYYEHDGFWTEHAFGPLDHERIQRTVKAVPEEVTSVLDAGCGNGLFCNLLSVERASIRVVGVDRSEAALSRVRTEKVRCSIDNLTFPDASFDCVCSLQVLEHLPVVEYEKALREIARVASRWIVVSVPYQESLGKNITRCPECCCVFNVDLHLRSYSLERVQNLFVNHGFDWESGETMGTAEWYIGQDLYRRVVYPGKQYAWRSPICPLCGYRAEAADAPRLTSRQRGLASRILARAREFPKAIWPKRRRPYWILARYRRSQRPPGPASSSVALE